MVPWTGGRSPEDWLRNHEGADEEPVEAAGAVDAQDGAHKLLGKRRERVFHKPPPAKAGFVLTEKDRHKWQLTRIKSSSYMPRSIRHQKQVGVEVTDVTVENRLIDALTARELSQEECARRIRISSRQFHRILTGAIPRLDVALALEVVLATPLKDLFAASIKTRPAR